MVVRQLRLSHCKVNSLFICSLPSQLFWLCCGRLDSLAFTLWAGSSISCSLPPLSYLSFVCSKRCKYKNPLGTSERIFVRGYRSVRSTVLPIFFAVNPPTNRLIMKSTIKMKNNTLAMPTAVPAIPPNPNSAAISAIIKNSTAHRNIYK